jgi:hypothetical protein
MAAPSSPAQGTKRSLVSRDPAESVEVGLGMAGVMVSSMIVMPRKVRIRRAAD